MPRIGSNYQSHKNRLIFTDVTFRGRDGYEATFELVLDTGASGVTIDEDLLQLIDCERLDKKVRVNTAGGVQYQNQYKVVVQVGIKELEMTVHTFKSPNEKIQGLLGMEFLMAMGGQKLVIDFEQSQWAHSYQMNTVSEAN